MAVTMSRGRRLLGRFNLLLAAVLAFAVWVAVTALATRPAFKKLIDLTPQAQFSVSAETEQLLADLGTKDAVVRVDTFYARMPTPRNAAEQHFVAIQQRIRELTNDLLVRYRELGGERIEVHHYDPLSSDFAEARARIEALGGLTQENVVVVSVGQRHKELQLSMDLAEIDVPAARPQVAPGARQQYPTLRLYKGEEAISTAIRSLLVEGTPTIYFLMGYHGAELEAGVGDSYSEFVRALELDGFRVLKWDLERERRVPADADVVVALEPRDEISPEAASALYRWLRNGGRMLLDLSWSEVPGPNWNPGWDALGRLCGFEFGADLVCHLVPDAARPESPGVGGIQARGLIVTGLAPHPITRPLAAASRWPMIKDAREVRPRGADGPAGVTFEPILRTGPWGWIARRGPGGMEPDYTPPSTRDAYDARTIGAVVDVPPEGAGRPGHVVLLGGVAFLNQRGMERNGDLGLNIANWLVQRTELVTVRGNRYQSRRIELVPQQVERAGTLLKSFVPGGLLVLGFVVLLLRRRR